MSVGLLDLPDDLLDRIVNGPALTNLDQALTACVCSHMRRVIVFRHVQLRMHECHPTRDRLTRALRGGACETLNATGSGDEFAISCETLNMVGQDHPALVARLREVHLWWMTPNDPPVLPPARFPALKSICIVNQITNPMVLEDPRVRMLKIRVRDGTAGLVHAAHPRVLELDGRLAASEANLVGLEQALEAGFRADRVIIGETADTANGRRFAAVAAALATSSIQSIYCGTPLAFDGFRADTVTSLDLCNRPGLCVALEALYAAPKGLSLWLVGGSRSTIEDRDALGRLLKRMKALTIDGQWVASGLRLDGAQALESLTIISISAEAAEDLFASALDPPQFGALGCLQSLALRIRTPLQTEAEADKRALVRLSVRLARLRKLTNVKWTYTNYSSFCLFKGAQNAFDRMRM